MRNIDDILNDALSSEDREVLRRIGPGPGLFGMTRGLFTGRLGWVNIVLMIVQGIAFLGGAYAAWRFFQANDPSNQLRWGLPAMTLLLMSGQLKTLMWPAVHADRVIREIKRLELQLADRSIRSGD